MKSNFKEVFHKKDRLKNLSIQDESFLSLNDSNLPPL